ncbi:hypothetical protein TNCV_886411 [Trichonephila clavipes]|nr:hypothetical protein TNCV_886411 [Trichonephila clavipes]
MNDNARPHKGQLVAEYLQSEDSQRLERCPLSLISSNTYETSLEAQLQLKDQFQRPSMSSRVPWCKNGCGCHRG